MRVGAHLFSFWDFLHYDPGLTIWWKMPSLGTACTSLKGDCVFDLFYSKVLILIHMRKGCGLHTGLPLGNIFKWRIVALDLFAFSVILDILHKHFLFICTVLSYIPSGLLYTISQKPFIYVYLTFVQLSAFVADPWMSLTSIMNMILYLSAWQPLNSTCDLTLRLWPAHSSSASPSPILLH